MKRDLTILRRILQAVEAYDGEQPPPGPLKLDGIERHVTAEHVALLEEGGYLELAKPHPTKLSWIALRLTQDGQEFLAAIRDDALFAWLLQRGAGQWPIAIVLEVAVRAARPRTVVE